MVIVLAVAAASGVFLFMNTVRDRADEGRVTVDVLVATGHPGRSGARSAHRERGLPNETRGRSGPPAGRDHGRVPTPWPTDRLPDPGRRADRRRQARGSSSGWRGPRHPRRLPGGLDHPRAPTHRRRRALQQGDHVEVFGTFSTRGNGSQTTHVVIDDALVLAVTSPEQERPLPQRQASRRRSR